MSAAIATQQARIAAKKRREAKENAEGDGEEGGANNGGDFFAQLASPQGTPPRPPLSLTRPRTRLSLPQKRARDRRKIVARPPPHLTRIPLRRREEHRDRLALLPLERLAGRESETSTFPS